jgi:hypothetical protein
VHDTSAEHDGIEDLGPGELPRVAIPEPVVGLLHLRALLDPLIEEPVFVFARGAKPQHNRNIGTGGAGG